MKKQLLFGLAISVLALWWVLKDVDYARMGQALRAAQYGWLIPSMVFTMLGYVVRAYRWKFLLMPVKSIRTRSLFSATIIGFFANVVLPARLGEIIRPWVIGRREGVSKTASFATIVVERLFDVTTLLLCFGLVAIFYGHTLPDSFRRGAIGLFAINLGGVAFLVGLRARTEASLGLCATLLRPLPGKVSARVLSLLRSFAEGLGSLSNGHHMLRISLLSILMWLTIVLSIWTCLQSLHLALPAYASAVLVVVISLGIMIPSAPGYLGVMNVACQTGLAIFGVDKTTAFTFSILYLVTQHLPVLISGFYYMWAENLSLGEISHVGAPERGAAP